MATELLEFWATGCKHSLPCHRAVEQLRAANDLGVTIRSIDSWDAPLDVATYRVVQLPTLLLCVDGVELARCSPAHPSPTSITSWVAHLLDTDSTHGTLAAGARAHSG